MTKTALDNKKNIQSHGEITTENIYRKILAKNPNDIDVWLKLFSILIAKFNFQEINFLVKKALYLNPTSLSLKKICFYALLHALKIDEANKLVESKDFMGALKADSLFLNHLYYLCLVTKITNKQVAYDYDSSVAVAGKDFRGFNHSFKFNEGSNLIDVVFYLKESFHFSIQSEIAIKLRELGVNVIFTDELWVVLYLSPKILVLSEVFHRNFGAVRALLPKALFVNTRHGLADKNYVAVGASNADIICVSSESILNLFTDNYLIDKSKIWVTGYPQMDGLFSNLLKENSTNKNARSKKVVLFAPTFTQNLNCMNLIKNQCLTKLIRGKNMR